MFALTPESVEVSGPAALAEFVELGSRNASLWGLPATPIQLDGFLSGDLVLSAVDPQLLNAHDAASAEQRAQWALNCSAVEGAGQCWERPAPPSRSVAKTTTLSFQPALAANTLLFPDADGTIVTTGNLEVSSCSPIRCTAPMPHVPPRGHSPCAV